MNLTDSLRPAGDFKNLLQDELIERCRKNPSYSLRAFARSLKIVPSALSDMLNGRRTITNASIERLGLALGLSLDEIERFQSQNPKTAGSAANVRAAQFQQITIDSFALISDWYHYAILELMKVKGFKPDVAWIARALDITKLEAKSAVERLERLGLIEIAGKKWILTAGDFSTNIEPGLTSIGSRKLQKQILELSLNALESVELKKRNHTSMTMAIDPADLPEAAERITRFRRELCAYLERHPKPKEVYHLSVSLFPASQIHNS